MATTLSRRAVPTRAEDRAGPGRRDEGDSRSSRPVKGTLELPEEIVQHQCQVLNRALSVLKSQWGLSAVELKVRAAGAGQAARLPAQPGTRSRLQATAFHSAWNICDRRRGSCRGCCQRQPDGRPREPPTSVFHVTARKQGAAFAARAWHPLPVVARANEAPRLISKANAAPLQLHDAHVKL